MAEGATPEPARRRDLLDDFWVFLVRTGSFEEKVIREYRDRHHETWTPLSSLLIEEHVLEMSQVAVLLRKQLREPHMRIGDLAVREGFCSREDVDRMLEHQEERCPHPVDLILGDDRIEAAVAVDALKSYVRHLEGRVDTLQRRLDGESVLKVHRSRVEAD